MKTTENLELITLLVGLLLGACFFYAIPYSGLKQKYGSLLDDYVESQNEIARLQEDLNQLSYYYDVLYEQYESLQVEFNSFKNKYNSLKSENDLLNEAYSSLRKKNSDLQNELKPPPIPFSGDPGSSPEYAAEIGTRVTCPFMFDEEPGYEVVMKVVDVISGKDAYDELKLRGVDVPAPSVGDDYLLVKLQIEYTEAPRPLKFIEGSSFHVFSINGDLHDPPWVDTLEPDLWNITFHKDWKAEGWITFEVPENETRQLLSFASGGSFNSGYWFKLFI